MTQQQAMLENSTQTISVQFNELLHPPASFQSHCVVLFHLPISSLKIFFVVIKSAALSFSILVIFKWTLR